MELGCALPPPPPLPRYSRQRQYFPRTVQLKARKFNLAMLQNIGNFFKENKGRA